VTGYCNNFHKPSQLQGRDKDYDLNRLAQAAFRELYKGDGDAFADLQLWESMYPGVIPEPFATGDKNIDSRYKQRQGRNAIHGKERGGTRSGGYVGRCRVSANGPLQHRVLAFSLIKELRHLELDPTVQFDAKKIAYVQKVLRKYLPDLCCVFIHYSTGAGRNHIHILCCPGATDLGSNCGVVPDARLATLTGYLLRKPDFTPEIAVAYIQAKRASCKEALPSRHFDVGCSPRSVRIGLEAIENVLGTLAARRPFRRVQQHKLPVRSAVIFAEPEQLRYAALPLLRGATPDCLELVGRLHQAWIQGTYEGMPARVGAGKTDDLAYALSRYFVRKWLAPGEVYDLENLALSLNLHVSDLVPETQSKQGFVTRMNIRGVFAAS
jgi:hypothetical protein